MTKGPPQNESQAAAFLSNLSSGVADPEFISPPFVLSDPMRRLSPPVAVLYEGALQRSATPLAFDLLGRDLPRNRDVSALRCEELTVRFSHQLERLRRVALSPDSAQGPLTRAGARALDVLLALHTDTVQKVRRCQCALSSFSTPTRRAKAEIYSRQSLGSPSVTLGATYCQL